MCSLMRSERSQSGFTLVEVLVALAVVAVALAATLFSASQSAASAAQFRDLTLGNVVARNAAIEFQLQEDWPKTGNSDGDVELGGGDWRWEAEVIETADENIRRANIQVFLLGGDEPRLVSSLSVFLPKPSST